MSFAKRMSKEIINTSKIRKSYIELKKGKIERKMQKSRKF
jgi:hypothetical protein